MENCPFCNARYATIGHWICGTYLDGYAADGEELYKTGKDCNLVCFRNCVIRQAFLLREVLSCAVSYEALSYSDVQIPKELLEAIRKEVDEIPPNK